MIFISRVERVVRDTVDPARYRAYDIRACIRGKFVTVGVFWDRVEKRLSNDRGYRKIQRHGGLKAATNAVRDEVIKDFF